MPPLPPETPAARLSGGQAMRAALAGAWLADADFLILDEPSNHLDREGREALQAQLRRWRGGLLVISHDRGLQRHGGGWSFYVERRDAQRAQAEAELERRKLERRQATARLQREAERQQRRQSQARQERADGSQPRCVLDF
ncbi:ATP-binding cassette domain-containing protein, partial [Rubrivivax gelatinosus]|uniref:ATP-binding cassette domain-containing protein n=1 Tax=Rubrivivax gelatinosus TaxID=28068 RepID=UPI001ED91742